jgi:hypothetical protein
VQTQQTRPCYLGDCPTNPPPNVTLGPIPNRDTDTSATPFIDANRGTIAEIVAIVLAGVISVLVVGMAAYFFYIAPRVALQNAVASEGFANL